jgi:NTP pyrophosphatase (non-canonical NTP hydrolase)
MEIKVLQKALREEYYARDRERGVEKNVLWLVEEVGELAEAVLKKGKNSIEEEIADVIAWTISVANLLGVDVEEALTKKYPFLKNRDYHFP